MEHAKVALAMRKDSRMLDDLHAKLHHANQFDEPWSEDDRKVVVELLRAACARWTPTRKASANATKTPRLPCARSRILPQVSINKGDGHGERYEADD